MIRRLALGISAAALLSGPAFAQTEQAGGSKGASLETVVVTATRRAEVLTKVPESISAFTTEKMDQLNAKSIADLVAFTPGVSYDPTTKNVSIRGVNSTAGDATTGIYIDDTPIQLRSLGFGSDNTLPSVFDLERVEVLRGPQGTLYGKNATGGAVSFYSKNPSLSEEEGYVTAGFGNYSAYSLNAAAGGPVVDDQLGVRAAILYEKRDGWVHSIVPGVEPLNGVDALAGRVTFLYRPSDTLTANLKLSMSRSGGTPYGAHALNNDPAATGFNGTIGWFDNGAKYAVHKDIRDDNATLKIDWQVSEHATLTSVTGFDYGRWYTKSDDGGLPITARLDDPNTYFSSTNDFSQELRLASHDTGAFGWLAGLYFGRESTHATLQYHFFDGYNLGFFALPDGTSLYGFDEYNNFDQIKESKAVFLNTTLEVVPTVTLHAGARFTKDNVAIRNFYALEGGPATPPVGLTPDGLTAAYWTQTIGALPATFTNYQQSLAAPGPTLNR
ncbi:MAG: iron complex outerrane recepter protein, partial [Alphaproteobacteria bacterium]|nr:iron complex outerrane recepter protein [Alphaproteobacteria bacterium]